VRLILPKTREGHWPRGIKHPAKTSFLQVAQTTGFRKELFIFPGRLSLFFRPPDMPKAACHGRKVLLNCRQNRPPFTSSQYTREGRLRLGLDHLQERKTPP
jgi:hypothetical protein